jgi:hypothetical protein
MTLAQKNVTLTTLANLANASGDKVHGCQRAMAKAQRKTNIGAWHKYSVYDISEIFADKAENIDGVCKDVRCKRQ